MKNQAQSLRALSASGTRLFAWSRVALWAAAWTLALVGFSACSGTDPDPDPYDYPPHVAAGIPLDGQMLYPVRIDDEPGYFPMVVDTGAVRTAVDERFVRDIVNDVGLVTLDFGNGLVFEDIEVIAADLSLAENYIGTPIFGLIGQDIFLQAYFGMDYRASEVTAASHIPELPPPDFAESPGVNVPYDLDQGLPVVDVDIGGSTARLIADTGSGVTILTQSFVDQALLDTGFTGYWWHTSYGSDPGTVVRLPSLIIGGHDVGDTWAVIIPDDYHLKPVFDAINLNVHGFLGFPVYRRFYVAVHGSEHRYVFYPYEDLPHVDALEWDRVGLELRREEGQVMVDMVYEPSDASTAGVAVDDVLHSVDGEPVGDLTLDEARLLLRGTPGEVRTLELERGGPPLTLDVAVERLLPPLS